MGSSATGETIYNMIEHFLFSGKEGEKRKLHLMGIASDHASNLISSGMKSMTSRLMNEGDTKHIVVVHDICHALNLALKDCLSCFSPELIKIVNRISESFSKSPHNSARLKEIIGEMKDKDTKVSAIKKYIKTRWSSFRDSLQRILQLWLYLVLFFKEKDELKQ